MAHREQAGKLSISNEGLSRATNNSLFLAGEESEPSPVQLQ
jgi:hypothetical protein